MKHKAVLPMITFPVYWTAQEDSREAVTTLHSLIAQRTGRIGCPTWNTAEGTEGFDPVLLACIDFEIPKSSNWYRGSIQVVTIDYLFNNRIAIMSDDNVAGNG